MTAEQFKKLMRAHYRTNALAAQALGITIRTFYRYAAGRQPIPKPIANLVLLRLANEANEEKPDDDFVPPGLDAPV